MITAHSFLQEVCQLGKAWFVESSEEVKLVNEVPRDKRRRRRLAATREAFTGCKDWESFFDGHIFGRMTEEEFQVKYRQVAYDLAADSLRLRPDARAFVFDIEIKSGKHLHFNPAEMIAKTLSKFHLQILFHEAIDAYTKICRARSRSSLLEGSGFIVYIFERIDEIQESVDFDASQLLHLAVQCLAPNGESFEIDTLVKCFGFPDYEPDDFPNQDDFDY
jgi:hypothetical protein